MWLVVVFVICTVVLHAAACQTKAGLEQLLLEGARYGNLAELKHFISSGVNVNCRDTDGSTPLIVAAANGEVEAVQTLAKLGASIEAHNENGETALAVATRANDLTTVGLLLGYGADVNGGSGTSPLIEAAKADTLDSCRLLLRAKADVNQVDRHGYSALTYASANGDTTMVAFFLTLEVNIDHRSPDGTTPLMYAIGYSRLQSTKYLIKHGASVNAANKNGNTPLMFAMFQSSTPSFYFAKALLKKNASVDAQNNEGFTALMLAVMKKDVDTVHLLLRHGSNQTIAAKGGKTALEFALQSGHASIIALLNTEMKSKDNHAFEVVMAKLSSNNKCTIPTVKDGAVTSSNIVDNVVDVGAFAILACNPGYFAVSPNIIMCLEGGSWSAKLGGCQAMFQDKKKELSSEIIDFFTNFQPD